jgi:hypothetical protein
LLTFETKIWDRLRFWSKSHVRCIIDIFPLGLSLRFLVWSHFWAQKVRSLDRSQTLWDLSIPTRLPFYCPFQCPKSLEKFKCFTSRDADWCWRTVGFYNSPRDRLTNVIGLILSVSAALIDTNYIPHVYIM